MKIKLFKLAVFACILFLTKAALAVTVTPWGGMTSDYGYNVSCTSADNLPACLSAAAPGTTPSWIWNDSSGSYQIHFKSDNTADIYFNGAFAGNLPITFQDGSGSYSHSISYDGYNFFARFSLNGVGGTVQYQYRSYQYPSYQKIACYAGSCTTRQW